MPIDTKQMDSGVAVVTVTGRLVLGKDVDIGTLVACLTQIKKAKGDLRMAGAKARMLRLFKMTGVDSLMSLHPTVAEASAG